jgi:hypothetical protein
MKDERHKPEQQRPTHPTNTLQKMKLTMPAVLNLLVAALTVASVFANTVLDTSELNMLDPSPPLRGVSGKSLSCTGQVTGWELYDTTTNKKVQDLANGDIVYSTNPTFSIRAVVTGSGTRSVRLTLNDGYTYTGIAPPYALCDNSGRRRCDGLVYGSHVVLGTACCDRDRRGTCRRPATTLSFEIRRPAPSSEQGSNQDM